MNFRLTSGKPIRAASWGRLTCSRAVAAPVRIPLLHPSREDDVSAEAAEACCGARTDRTLPRAVSNMTREFMDPGVAAQLAGFREARRQLEASVLPLATSVDGRRFSFQASLYGLPLQVGA